MKLLTLLQLILVLSLFLFLSLAQAQSFNQECPDEVSSNDILAERTLFFTVPSLTSPALLQLMYANSNEVNDTGLTFSPNSILEINPSGSYIGVIVAANEYTMSRDSIYEHTGSELQEFILINTSTLSASSLALNDYLMNIQFIRRVQWLDDRTILLLSTPEYHKLAILDVITNSIELLDWSYIEPYPYTPFPDGSIALSPNGNYLLYTVADPPIASINGENNLAWWISGIQGDYEREYITGIGSSARWLDNENIIVQNIDNSLSFINIISGDENRIIFPDGFVLSRILPSPDMMHIAFTRHLGFEQGYDRFSLAILNDNVLNDYCLNAIELKKEAWSSDSQLIAYVARDIDYIDLYILDIKSNEFARLLPLQPLNAAIGDRFIRVVGWQQ